MNPPRILTPREIDEFLRVYELEVDLPDWHHTAIRQGLAMAKDAAAAGYANADHGVDWSVRRGIYDRAAGRCEYCAEPVGTRRVGQPRGRRDREIDHMLSRYGLLAVGASWATIHHPANLASACTRCNSEKGTGSLSPADLDAMWDVLGVDRDDPAVPLLKFYSQVLDHRRFRIRRLDPIPTRPGLAIGAYTRRPNPPASALLRHHPRRVHFVEHDLYAHMWARELASDDNREMWRR